MAADRVSLFIVLYCSLNFPLVEGLYFLQARVNSFRNPNQRSFHCNGDIDGCFRCCDDRDLVSCESYAGDRRCDTFFIFCLRPLGTTGFGCGSNTNSGSVIQSDVNENDATSIDFFQSTFLGLSNPVNLTGLTNNWKGVQLYIIAMDEDDGNNDQTIATATINTAQPVDSSRRRFLTLPETSVAINVTLTVHCAQNFQVPDCTECIPGFTGEMCDENIDDCLEAEETCSDNGQCVDGVNSITCNCNPGFTGEKCRNNINECIDPGVNCSGNGQCVDVFGSYYCNCSAGYNGTNCEINIDDCSPDPCGANGLCIDGVDSFTCNCTTGYNGTLCDSDIDECLSNPCGMNQQCENQVGSFNCRCDPGFTSDLCQTKIDDCVGVNCQEIQGSPGIQTSPIIGGVSGGLIFLVLILVIVVAMVLTMRCLNRQGKEGTAAYSNTLPGDNPMYDRGNTAVTFGALTQTSAPVHYVNLSSGDRPSDNMAGSAPDRVFDNPIYGGNDEETEGTYADPDTNHHAGTGMGSSPYHEFDNPIYGGEADESSTYSLLANSNATRGGTHTTGSEQVYDHVN